VRHRRRLVVDGALVQLADGLSAEVPRVLPVQVAVADGGLAAALPAADLPGAGPPHPHPPRFAHMFEPVTAGGAGS
jgi:hypothetical protein